MSYKINFLLLLCVAGSIKSSDFGASCSSDEFEDKDSKITQTIISSTVVRSAQSISPDERENRSLQIHKIEKEIGEFQRDLRRKNSGVQLEYEELSNDPKFLTDEEFVEKKVGSFHAKVCTSKEIDQEKFNALSKKVSSLRGSFRTRLPEGKEILSEENPVDSLIGSLRVVAREHGFKESPFLQVPVLKLNGSKVFFKPEQESECDSELSIACNLGSGIRQVESIGDDKSIVINSRRLKTRNNCFTLKEDYVDETFLDENNDIDSDTQEISKSDKSFEMAKKSSKDSLDSLKSKPENMNDDDSDYE